LGALVSGGSDFHGEDPSKPERIQRSMLGAITLPAEDLAALERKARNERPPTPRLRRDRLDDSAS
jgi:hypothetical protein